MSLTHALRLPATPLPLLDLVELLGELASDRHSLPEVPRLFVSLLPLDRATFAVIEQTVGEADRILVASGFEAASGSIAAALPSGALQHDRMMNLCRPEAALPPAAADPRVLGKIEHENPPAAGHAPFELVRQFDANHKLALVLEWGRRLSAMPEDFTLLLDSIGDILARALGCLFAWSEHPALLGRTFSHLTQSQWRVLGHLCTHCSEKELADVLQMAPHTLHSHIKKIYRTLGVRSRIEVVHRLRQAVRQYRIAARTWSPRGDEIFRDPLSADLDAAPPVRIWTARDPLRRCSAVGS